MNSPVGAATDLATAIGDTPLEDVAKSLLGFSTEQIDNWVQASKKAGKLVPIENTLGDVPF